MIQDKTIDEALIELMRTKKALEALRKARKEALGQKKADIYSVTPRDGDFAPEEVAKAMAAPYRSPYCRLQKEHAAAKRASLDLTRKLADLRAGR